MCFSSLQIKIKAYIVDRLLETDVIFLPKGIWVFEYLSGQRSFSRKKAFEHESICAHERTKYSIDLFGYLIFLPYPEFGIRARRREAFMLLKSLKNIKKYKIYSRISHFIF